MQNMQVWPAHCFYLSTTLITFYKGMQFLVSVDHSRVKLSQAQDDDEGADYINANYVPVSL